MKKAFWIVVSTIGVIGILVSGCELVVDFDVHDPPGGREDLHAAWHRLQSGPDIVWAPYHGGHWIPTRAADIDFIQRTHDRRRLTRPARLDRGRLRRAQPAGPASPSRHSRRSP